MNLVVVGRVGAPHGISGAVRVTSSTQPPENIERYRPWLVGSGGHFREVEVLGLRRHGHGYVVHLAGVDDRDQARALTGLSIAVRREVLPELASSREYYWQDLIGMTVVDGKGRRLGTVSKLLATGAHDVLVIGESDQETLVPFVDAFVLDVDTVARIIRVDWPEPI